MAASRKKSFHISINSHNVEVKLCNLYQFLKRNGIASWTIFCPSFIFHHCTENCIWLMLFLRKQILVLVKQFTSASSIEMFLSGKYVVNLYYKTSTRLYSAKENSSEQKPRSSQNDSDEHDTKVKDANQGMHSTQSTRATVTLQGIDYHILPPVQITCVERTEENKNS